jgi:hypothetical protein
MIEYAKSPLQRQVCKLDKSPETSEEITDDAYGRIKSLVGDGEEPKKFVDVRLTTNEKVAMHADILERLRTGHTPESVALAVMASINEHLLDKYKESTGAQGPKGPVFRRSE